MDGWIVGWYHILGGKPRLEFEIGQNNVKLNVAY